MSPQTVHSPGSLIPAQAPQMPAKAESPLSEASYAWPSGRLRGVQTSVPSCVDPRGQKAAVTEGLQAGLCLETRGKEGQEFTRWRRGRKNILLSRCNALVARIKLTSEIVKKKKKCCGPSTAVLKVGFPRTVASASPGVLLETQILRRHPRFTESETLGSAQFNKRVCSLYKL